MVMAPEEAIRELKDASDAEVRYGDIEHHYDDIINRVKAFDVAIKVLGILENADNIIESEYGCVIIEGYADVVDQMKEACKGV